MLKGIVCGIPVSGWVLMIIPFGHLAITNVALCTEQTVLVILIMVADGRRIHSAASHSKKDSNYDLQIERSSDDHLLAVRFCVASVGRDQGHGSLRSPRHSGEASQSRFAWLPLRRFYGHCWSGCYEQGCGRLA